VNSERWFSFRWTQVLSADGRRPARPPLNLLPILPANKDSKCLTKIFSKSIRRCD
jgi:hypothetical protein